MVSDRDSPITIICRQFWADVCHYTVVKRKLSTAFHPQTNGQSEILDGIVENYLRAFINLEQMNWAKPLPAAMYTYNDSLNHTLKMTPFKAMYGCDPVSISMPRATSPGGPQLRSTESTNSWN
jgi:hypothetical protein